MVKPRLPLEGWMNEGEIGRWASLQSYFSYYTSREVKQKLFGFFLIGAATHLQSEKEWCVFKSLSSEWFMWARGGVVQVLKSYRNLLKYSGLSVHWPQMKGSEINFFGELWFVEIKWTQTRVGITEGYFYSKPFYVCCEITCWSQHTCSPAR